MKHPIKHKCSLLIIAAVLLLPLLTGCSLKYASHGGGVTYIGLLWLRHYPAGNTIATHTKRIGMAIDAGSQRQGFLVGYENLVSMHPPSDKVIRFDYSSEAGGTYRFQTGDGSIDMPDYESESSVPDTVESTPE